MAKKIKIKPKKTSPKLKKADVGLEIGEDSFNPEAKLLTYNAFKNAGYFDDYAVSTRMTNNESGYDFTKPLFNQELGQFQQPVKEQNNVQFPKSKKFQPNIQGSRSSTETFMTGLKNLPAAIQDPSNPAAWAAVGDLPMTGTKAILEQIGARKTNNRLNRQSVEQFQDAQTLNFLNNYNDSQYGTTNIGMMEDGGIAKYKSMNQDGLANVLTENKEVGQLPSGLIDTMYGDNHSDPSGGIHMNLPEGSKIFSEKLKHPEKKKSFAKLAKKFETKKDFENLESPIADDINKFTADLNIQFKNKASDELFAEQENMKLNGVFGDRVKNNTMKDYEMKYGGLTKAEDGEFVGRKFKTKEGYLTPQGVDLNAEPLTNWGQIRDIWQKELNSPINTFGELQELSYDYLLDKAERGDKFATSQLQNMWKKHGVTNLGEKLGYKNKDLDNLNLQDLKDLRGAYIDKYQGKRKLLPNEVNSNTAISKAKQLRPSDKLEIPASTPIEKGKYNNQGFKAIPVLQPFQEPYLESPVARFTFNPNLIDYRNQNPDFTEIDRQYQGAKTGNPRIDANLFAKTLNAKNQIAFGTQAQNRQGQMQVDQYNAGALDRLQQLQYGEDNTYRGLVNQMRGALNTQKLMDRSVAQSNAQKQMDYYNFTLPTIETLYGVDPNEQYIKKDNPLKQYQKYGGKIKPKFKKKSSK